MCREQEDGEQNRWLASRTTSGDSYDATYEQRAAAGQHVHGEADFVEAYKPASVFSHTPIRKRKLLMHRVEIDRWATKVKERGYSIIPLVMYFKNGIAKIRLGLGKGKTGQDRRDTIKDREAKREMDRGMRRR